MRAPEARLIDLDAGRFRVLEWPGAEPAVLLLHGLTAVAESWQPTVDRLARPRRAVAFDQRGHGRSTVELPDARATALAADAVAVARALGLERPHVAGHSMGARIAIVAAVRHAEAFRSVAVVDIGPDAWKQNWVDTVAALDRMSDVVATGQLDNVVARRAFDEEMAAAFRARFEPVPGGGLRALGSRDAMRELVRTQRSRNYWRDWERIALPALLVRGGMSEELRPAVAAKMRERNPSVGFVELPGVGHNIPLLDPTRLAAALEGFWDEVDKAEAGSRPGGGMAS